METTPTTTKQPTPWWRGPRAALAAAAAIVVVAVAAFAIASLIGSDEPDAIGSSQPRATFDGDGCTYDGPTEFALNSEVTFIVVNATEARNVGFGVWAVPDGTTAAEIQERGIFEVVGVTSASADELKGVKFVPTLQDQEYEVPVTLDTPGQHAINCFQTSGLDHATIFTVVGG